MALAREMRANGTTSDDDYCKITLRDVKRAGEEPETAYPPLTAGEIRALRERAQMSQALFARCVNLSVGYVSQLERGAKRPSGPSLGPS